MAVVFLCGAAFGSALTRSYIHKKLDEKRTVSMSLQNLKTELRLTPAQEKIVTRELDDYVKYYQNIEEERQDVREVGKKRIVAVLTPEQRKRFNELFDQLPH